MKINILNIESKLLLLKISPTKKIFSIFQAIKEYILTKINDCYLYLLINLYSLEVGITALKSKTILNNAVVILI